MQSGGPGWNDPPKLTHKVHSETKTRKNLLNKRVAYLDQTGTDCGGKMKNFTSDMPPPTSQLLSEVNLSATSSPLEKSLAPPLNIFVPGRMDDQILPPKSETSAEKTFTDTVSQEAALPMPKVNSKTDIYHTLKKLTDRCKDSKNTVTTDINKKLEVLKAKLDDGSLSPEVVTKTKQMTGFLLNQHYDKAWDIHVSLMFDHISEVRLWMVGVKRLITELRKLDSV